MGQSLDRPVTDKTSFSGANDNIRYGVSKMQGWRNSMEDSECCHLQIGGWNDGWGFFAIFDGHAGSKASESSSKELLSHIVEVAARIKKGEIKHDDDVSSPNSANLPEDVMIMKKAIHMGFIEFDEKMREVQSSNSAEPSCGTTAVSVMVSPTHFIFANCGDSRGIFVRDGKLFFETKDHKPVDPEERSRIESAGGSVYMERVNGNLAVSRALGDFGFKNNPDLPSIKQAVSPEPTITVIERSLEDQFIFLACDGIWDVIQSQTAAELLLNRLTVESNLENICSNMIDTCLCQNSRDNMTSLLLCLPGSPSVDEGSIAKENLLESTIKEGIEKILSDSNNDIGVISLLAQLSKEKWIGLPDPPGIYAKSGFVIRTLDDLTPNRDKSKDYSTGGLLSELPLALQVVRNIASGQGVGIRREEM